MILPCLLFMDLLHAWLQLSIAGTNDDNNSIYLSIVCVCVCVFLTVHIPCINVHIRAAIRAFESCLEFLEYHPTIIPTFDQWLEILPIEFKFTITIPSKGGLFFSVVCHILYQGLYMRDICFKVKTNRYSKVQQ